MIAGTDYFYVTNFTMRKTSNAVLIEDGAVIANKIAADAVTAVKIAANTITAAKIAAGTITGTEIAATTLTGAKLVANTITAGQIAANTITAAQIAANTITATQIAANTITAAQIAADTITAAQIAAGAIATAELAAGAITADKIAAGAVTAKSILVTDSQNLLPNGRFEDTSNYLDYWSTITGGGTFSYITDPATSLSGPTYIRMAKTPATISVSVFGVQWIPVVPGEVLQWDAAIKGNAAAATGGFTIVFCGIRGRK